MSALIHFNWYAVLSEKIFEWHFVFSSQLGEKIIKRCFYLFQNMKENLDRDD